MYHGGDWSTLHDGDDDEVSRRSEYDASRRTQSIIERHVAVNAWRIRIASASDPSLRVTAPACNATSVNPVAT